MHLEIPDTTYQQLRAQAAAVGIQDVAAYIERLADLGETAAPTNRPRREAEVHGRSFTEGVRALGLLGKYDNLPADLSSNPKYLEGFGE